MATFDYDLVQFDGQSLTASPFSKVFFRQASSPLATRTVQPVEADVIGLGPQDVRAQPKASVWEAHCLLVDNNETTRDSFLKVFSSERGLAFLVANDGDGAVWRIEARVIRTLKGSDALNHYIAVLRIHDPRWEQNALKSVQGSLKDMSGDSASQSETNIGNLKSHPVYKISVDSQKTKDPAEDFIGHIRGSVVNRSPFFWSDLPIDLTDRDNVLIGWDTATLVRDTGSAGTLNGAIIAGATTMTLNAGHGLSDGGQFFYIDAEGANAIEQVYGVLSTNAVTGMIRGLGGTTDGAHGNTAAVNKSSMLKNGDDIRVYVNGREIQRWLGNIDTTTTRIWINATMPARVKLTSVNKGTSGDPANGGEIEFEEGVESLPENGVLWNAGDATPNRELISYTGRDVPNRKVTGVRRGIWNGNGTGTAWAAGDPFFLVNYLTVIAYGRGVSSGFSNPLPAPPSPSDRRPAIQLKSSDNNTWRYGDQADDPNTIFYDKDTPNRTAMWVPDYHLPSGDNNNARALQLSDSSDIAKWKDAEPIHGKLQVGRLKLALPQGIKAAASAITYDVQHRLDMRMRILGRAADGLEVELLDSYDEDAGALAAQVLTPAAVLHEITLNAVRSGVLRDNGSTTVAFNNKVGQFLMCRFTLNQDTEVVGVILTVFADPASPDFSFTVKIFDDSGGATPETGRVVWEADRVNGNSGPTFDDSHITTAAKPELFTNSGGNFLLPAGAYWVQTDLTAHVSGLFRWRVILLGHSIHKRIRFDQSDPLSPEDGDEGKYFEWFLLHPHGGPIQPESALPVLDSDAEASFDKLILELNTATADPFTPWVDRPVLAEGDTYHVIGELKNTTTGETIDLDFFIDTGGEIVIDTEAKRVTYEEGTWVWDLPVGITPSNLEDWLALDPGANTIQYTEQDMVNTDLRFEYRGQKV